jgi:endo-1,3(4)-beta-glucanase
LIRTLANPSDKDEHFPTWRYKDWYQGSSWASGIAQTYTNGKNQESSSEAIAAWEGIALYGQVMVSRPLCRSNARSCPVLTLFLSFRPIY